MCYFFTLKNTRAVKRKIYGCDKSTFFALLLQWWNSACRPFSHAPNLWLRDCWCDWTQLFQKELSAIRSLFSTRIAIAKFDVSPGLDSTGTQKTQPWLARGMNNLACVAGWREWMEGVGGEDREGRRKYDRSRPLYDMHIWDILRFFSISRHQFFQFN